MQILTLNVANDSLGSGGVGGVPAYSPAANMLFITDAGPGVTGVSAGIVGLNVTSGCTLQVAWNHALSGNDFPNSTPTLANGLVFVGEGNTGIVHAYNAQTGLELWNSGTQLNAASTFAAPTVANGSVYVGSWTSYGGGGIVGSFALKGFGSTWAISGNVSANGAGATVALSGVGTGTVTADSGGNYSFSGLANGSYTVTPTKGGYTFSPSSQNVSVRNANVSGVNFTASQSRGSGLAIDAEVFSDTTAKSTTIASPTFSTIAGNELVLAFISTDYLSGTNTKVTGITGGGLTWTLVVRTNVQSGSSEIWRAFSPSPLSNVTTTATLSQSVVASMTVMSFTGVDTTGTNGSGAIGATTSANSRTGAPTATLVTTRNNSWVFGVGNDYDNAIARTPGTGQSLVHQDLTSTGDTYWVQMQNNPTPLSGTSVTINDTAPTTDRYNLSVVEVRAP